MSEHIVKEDLLRSGDAPERVARINLDAFRHNVRVLAGLAAPAETMVAVKADAYGHGMVELAAAALEAGATALAVLDIPAALALREAGFTVPIFAWMHGPDADFDGAVAAGIDIGVSALWQLERIADAHGRLTDAEPACVHLKIDTGLHRNGATVEQWPGLVTRALELDAAGSLRLYAAWSHLADASPEHDRDALDAFRAAVTVAEGLGARFVKLHLAASSAGIRMPEARFDMVRFGIAAYGVSPFDDETAEELGLRPVMTLTAPVVSVKRVPAGHGVSYGFDYRTTRETTLALVPLGYADGIPRAASGRGEVWIGGTRYRVAGRVAMDQIVVDVGDAPVALGDEVVVFGEAPGAGAGAGAAADAGAGAGASAVPTAEEWAGWARTIGDEIVARVGPRVVRQYVGDKAAGAERAGEAEAEADAEGDAGAVESWVVADPEAMHALGVQFAGRLAAGDVLVLTGELGAGKTTFTRGLGEGLGVRGAVTSPTFVLARTHPNGATGVPLVHVDAYRLGAAAELEDLDIDFAHSIVVVEWGAGMIENLVDGYSELVIERPRGDSGDGAVRAGDDGAAEGAGGEVDVDEPVEPRRVALYRRGAAGRALASGETAEPAGERR
ncbi:alanine racemase [Subtercola sp. Z020]|uniref:alanine racemase n=1 Tax=Subtercola sp. Z020 TaxID=2080582 RepID=UPI001E35B2E9|nr:alanine racemase [Subtercola sp. Z020]